MFLDPPLIFSKFFCCVVIQILNFLKDSMWLIQKKLTFFLCKLDSHLQMCVQSLENTDTIVFPTDVKAGDILSPYIGKPDIYRRKV